MLASSAAPAGQWQFVPSLSVSETYTDNAQLDARDPQADFFTSIIPGMSIRGLGRRVTLTADYTYEQTKFMDNNKLDRSTHNLQGRVTGEIIRDHLFIDGFGAMFPSLVSNTGQISNRNRNRRDRLDQLGVSNRTDVVSYGVTPRYQHALGTFANFTASTTYSDVSTGNTGGNTGNAGGGSNNDWKAALTSGRRFARTSWGIDYSRRSGSSQGGGSQDSTFQSLTASGGYQINRLIRATGSIGTEDNSFSSDQGQRGGPSWSVGAILTPSPRTTLSGTFGQRSFGDTKQFSFEHSRRRFTLHGNYTEELRTSAEVLRDRQIFGLTDPFGNPIPVNPSNNATQGLSIDGLSLTNDVFITRRLDTSIGYFRKRDQFSVNIYQDEQESTRTAVVESTVGAGASWTRSMSYGMSVGLNADYQVRTTDSLGGSSTLLFVSPFLSYAIGPNLNSRLSYTYNDNASDFGDDSFTENTVQGSLSYAF